MKTARASFFCIIGFMLATAPAASADVKTGVKKGNILYNNKKFDEALKCYEKALAGSPDSGIANFNRGDALYRMSTYAKAVGAFNKAIASGKTDLVAAADYNIGDSQYRLGNIEEPRDTGKAMEFYEAALAFYKRSIDLNPDDRDAKFNYELTLKRLKQLRERKDEKRDKEEKQDREKPKEKKEEEKKEESKPKEKKEEPKPKPEEKRPEEKKKEEPKKEEAKKSEEKEKEPKPEPKKPEEKKQEEKKKEEPAEKEEKKKGPETEEGKPKEDERKEEKEPKESDKQKEERNGFEFYQQVPQEPKEMTQDEARMLLDGYKGEEATGRTVRMLRKPVDEPEPLKDW